MPTGNELEDNGPSFWCWKCDKVQEISTAGSPLGWFCLYCGARCLGHDPCAISPMAKNRWKRPPLSEGTKKELRELTELLRQDLGISTQGRLQL